MKGDQNATKHTAGPWKIEHIKGLDLGASAEVMAGKLVVAQVWKTDDNISRWNQDETGKANAALISAAPELLEALKELTNQEDWEGEEISPESPIGKARKAISKAEGGNET